MLIPWTTDLFVPYMYHTQKITVCISYIQKDRQTDRYFIDRKEVITDLFVIEMTEISVHVYTRLLTC